MTCARTGATALVADVQLPPAGDGPVGRLARIDQNLSREAAWNGNLRRDDPLVRYKAGLRILQSGDRSRAFDILTSVVEDPNLERRARFSPEHLQALIGSAELVGRELETRGRPEVALRIYGRVLGLRAPMPMLAGRTTRLAWRRRLAERRRVL